MATVGIFLRNQSICVVRDYCARGSLMDTLQNKDMKLDDVFITSFVDDLIRVGNCLLPVLILLF